MQLVILKRQLNRKERRAERKDHSRLLTDKVILWTL
jgi:hypothetical protein